MILPIHGALAKMAQTPWAVDHKRLSGPVQISRFPREDLDQDLSKFYFVFTPKYLVMHSYNVFHALAQFSKHKIPETPLLYLLPSPALPRLIPVPIPVGVQVPGKAIQAWIIGVKSAVISHLPIAPKVTVFVIQKKSSLLLHLTVLLPIP